MRRKPGKLSDLGHHADVCRQRRRLQHVAPTCFVWKLWFRRFHRCRFSSTDVSCNCSGIEELFLGQPFGRRAAFGSFAYFVQVLGVAFWKQCCLHLGKPRSGRDVTRKHEHVSRWKKPPKIALPMFFPVVKWLNKPLVHNEVVSPFSSRCTYMNRQRSCWTGSRRQDFDILPQTVWFTFSVHCKCGSCRIFLYFGGSGRAWLPVE